MTTTPNSGDWRTSSYSANADNCVEVRSASVATCVRDTKNRTGGELAFEAAAWGEFLGIARRAS